MASGGTEGTAVDLREEAQAGARHLRTISEVESVFSAVFPGEKFSAGQRLRLAARLREMVLALESSTLPEAVLASGSAFDHVSVMVPECS
jgi:hypothetical protein